MLPAATRVWCPDHAFIWVSYQLSTIWVQTVAEAPDELCARCQQVEGWKARVTACPVYAGAHL